MNNRSIPSLARIVQTDLWSLLSLLLPGVAWVLYLAAISGIISDSALFFFELAVGATLGGLAALYYRTKLIRGVFQRGVDADGVITSVSGRGRVEYVYDFQGQSYQSGNALHESSRTRQLHIRQRVALVVDPQRGERAFIRSLYLDE